MKTIGILLKEARIKKRYSLSKLQELTKIKKDFIDSIEKEKWSDLPEYPVVVGFVKSLAGCLDVGERQLIAFLRRDYPPKKLPTSINPKPDISNRFVWTPKLTFLIGITLVVLMVLGYLSFQYLRFITPPSLEVMQPKNEEVVKSRKVKVLGKTDADAVVRVNNQPVLIDKEGKFEGQIEIFEGTTSLVIKSVSRSGKETVIERKIIPELD